MELIQDTPLMPPNVSNLTNQLHGRDPSNASEALQNLNLLLNSLGLRCCLDLLFNFLDASLP